MPRPRGKGSLGHGQRHNRVSAVPPRTRGQPHNSRDGAGGGTVSIPEVLAASSSPLSLCHLRSRVQGWRSRHPQRAACRSHPHPPPTPTSTPRSPPHPAEPRGSPGTRHRRRTEGPHRARGRARYRRRGGPRDEPGGDPRPPPRTPQSDAERGPSPCGVTARDVTAAPGPAAMALGAAGHGLGGGGGWVGGVREGIGRGEPRRKGGGGGRQGRVKTNQK